METARPLETVLRSPMLLLLLLLVMKTQSQPNSRIGEIDFML